MAGVELRGLEKFSKKVDKMVQRTTNQAPAFKVIGQQGLADVLKHFRDESGPNGKWAPLKSRDGKILQDTGRLRGGTKAFTMPDRTILINNVAYGSYHQDGKGVPQRKFLWISDKAFDLMEKTLLRYFIQGK